MPKANEKTEDNLFKILKPCKNCKRNITTKAKSNQIVRLHPPVATTKLAYITFIIIKY